MNECTIPTKHHFTACASLAALGVHVSYLDLFGPIRETVLIAQKTVKHAPSDKLYDALSACWQGLMGWWKSIPVCAVTRCCRQPLAGQRAQSSRWCRGPWTLVLPRT